jgi:hypothetical protein
MAMITGTMGDDTLNNNVAESDIIDGGAGTDTVSYANAAGGVVVDLSGGFALDPVTLETDFLFSIENIAGSPFGDILIGDGGMNVLQGGAGDDALAGQGGADVFSYSFDVAAGGETFSFTQFFAAHGGQVVNGEVADSTSQGQFSSLYTKWLNMLIAEEGLGTKLVDLGQNSGAGGTPVIANMTGEFGERESFTWTTGSGKKAVTHVRWYSDTWSTAGGEETVANNGDGFDTILDFTPGEDKLDFGGITRDQFLNNFMADSSQDVNGDTRVDTVITIEGSNDWSLTLSGVSRDLLAIANDSTFS